MTTEFPELDVSLDAWWDVPVAEVSRVASVAEARAEYEEQRKSERHYL